MAHYELRKYTGWHHHMLTCMLAHFFLWHVKRRLGKKSPSAHGVAGEAVAGEGAALENLYPGGGPPLGAMDAAAQSCGVSVASKKSAPRRLMDDPRSPLTGLGTAWQGSIDVLDSNDFRLNDNLIDIRRPIFLASEQVSDGIWFGPTRTARHDGSVDNGSWVCAASWVSDAAVVKHMRACTRYAEHPESR